MFAQNTISNAIFVWLKEIVNGFKISIDATICLKAKKEVENTS
jgi:hypothetical protein